MVTGKVIVITGASSGIGAALAKQLGAMENSVVLAARREDQLKEMARECGKTAIPITADVRRREDVKSLRDQAIAEFGHVDVWINNAGRGITARVLDLTDEDFDEMMDVNLKSAWYGMQAIVPHFQQRGEGHLINISSHLSRVPFATFRSAYSASKAAMNTLTACLRLDLKKDYPNIHVSTVLPGLTLTGFAAKALHGAPPPPPEGAPRPQGQSPEEVAAAIVGMIERPVPELYTQPTGLETVQRYYADVAGFEEGMA
jgi:NAD(P)-dependent dehydrogenase (short-subunit alcohol dehydrogenase family)